MALGILRDVIGNGHAEHARHNPAGLAVFGADQIPVFERNGLGRLGGFGALGGAVRGLLLRFRHLDPTARRQRRERHRRRRNLALLFLPVAGPAAHRFGLGNGGENGRRRRLYARRQAMLQNFHLGPFLEQLETGRSAIGLRVHVQGLEYACASFGRHSPGVGGEAVEFRHLLRHQQLAIVGPSHDAGGRADFHEAAPVFDDVEPFAVSDGGDRGRFRIELLADIQRGRTGVGVPHCGGAVLNGLARPAGDEEQQRGEGERADKCHDRSVSAVSLTVMAETDALQEAEFYCPHCSKRGNGPVGVRRLFVDYLPALRHAPGAHRRTRDWMTCRPKISCTPFARFARVPCSPSRRWSRLRSASRPAPLFSASSTPCCCVRCPTAIPTGWFWRAATCGGAT